MMEEQIVLRVPKLLKCREAMDRTGLHVTRLVDNVVEHDPRATPVMLIEQLLPWLKGHKPASCYPFVEALSWPDFLCDIEAQAMIPEAMRSCHHDPRG